MFEHEMSMIRKTPTKEEYNSCEFHVTIENQYIYT